MVALSDKNKKSAGLKPTRRYLDLFYMSPSELRAKNIADLLQDQKDLKIELWPEMNVLELELSNRNTVDFEALSVEFKDPSDLAFIRNRKIRTIFSVNLAEEDLAVVKRLFELIIGRFSGFLCTDSADFQPILMGSAHIPADSPTA
jgi:hypothetical protein